MTLSVRNNCLRGGILAAALALGLAAAGGYFAFPVFPAVSESASLRPLGMGLLGRLVEASAYVPFWTALAAAGYSLVCVILIYYFFEKTQTPEIFFFAFFIISLSFEFARIAIPLKEVFPFPPMRLITASRVLLFGRYFGLFSLFAASVHAAGLDAQKQQQVFLAMILATMVIVLNVPIDILAWDSSLTMLNGCTTMLNVTGTGILAVTAATFFISAYTRGSRPYISIGIGSLLAFTGRNILINSDNWITPIPGLLILALGTWLICSRLHRLYLWT